MVLARVMFWTFWTLASVLLPMVTVLLLSTMGLFTVTATPPWMVPVTIFRGLVLGPKAVPLSRIKVPPAMVKGPDRPGLAVSRATKPVPVV